MVTRRRFAQTAGIAMMGGGFAAASRPARAANRLSEKLRTNFAAIEEKIAGHLGVAVLDTMTGETAGHRSEERFPLCSTFKLLASAAVLARVDAGKESLERRIELDSSILLPNSPATEKRVGGPGMTLAELCDGAITLTDNAAGNLLLEAIGGPAGLTAYMRSLGDPITRLGRTEPTRPSMNRHRVTSATPRNRLRSRRT
jgi:beta-lactamase class A